MSDFDELLRTLGVSWDIDREQEYLDVTFGDTEKKILVREIWTISYDGPSMSGRVTSGSKEAVMAATLQELFTRMR